MKKEYENNITLSAAFQVYSERSSKDLLSDDKKKVKYDDNYFMLLEAYEEEYKKTPLTPSEQGKDCLANGKHEGFECSCYNCEHFLYCFPQYKNMYDTIDKQKDS